jgi:hypothetical protein
MDKEQERLLKLQDEAYERLGRLIREAREKENPTTNTDEIIYESNLLISLNNQLRQLS